MTWTAYTETLQHFAALRRNAERESAQHQASYQAAQQQLHQITARVAAQKSQLSKVAAQLQLAPPWLDGIQPSATTDLGEALGYASQAASQADAVMNAAAAQSAAPRLLPGMSPAGRTATVYGAYSAIGWLAQCGLVTISGTDLGAALWSLCGLPALAFFAGFITLQILGQPRIGGKIHYPLKLGGAITFIGMPIAWIALIALASFLRT